MSKAKRIVLIQTNLKSVITHTMQCFQVPMKNCQKLDNINRNFFWKTSTSSKGMLMIAWDKIC